MAKAGPVLMAAMTSPATAGPMSPDSCCMTWTRALAGGSRRSPTSIGTMVFRAGWKKASTTPKMTASTYSCHSSALPVSTRNATTATTTARSAFEMIIRLRGETRSDMAPPSSMKTARGIAAAIRTVPSASAGSGQLQRQPGQRDEVELVADQRDGLAGEHQAEVRQPKRQQHGRPALRLLGAGAGSASRRRRRRWSWWCPSSLHRDDDAVAGLVLGLHDGAGRVGVDRLLDERRVALRDARHHPCRGGREGERDAHVDDASTALVDLDADASPTAAGDGPAIGVERARR